QGIPKESEFEPNKTINLINLIQLQYNFYTEIKKWSRLNLKKKKKKRERKNAKKLMPISTAEC
ncbi:MAG: hypothetical protein ABR909_13595, partial [Candidatus Bathyarchaeia archaeon]